MGCLPEKNGCSGANKGVQQQRGMVSRQGNVPQTSAVSSAVLNLFAPTLAASRPRLGLVFCQRIQWKGYSKTHIDTGGVKLEEAR